MALMATLVRNWLEPVAYKVRNKLGPVPTMAKCVVYHTGLPGTGLRPATQDYTVNKIGHARAILGGLGGLLGSTVNPPQIKSGRRIPLTHGSVC
jgi:hypothetical protein